MRFEYSQAFKKKAQRLPKKTSSAVAERLRLFATSPHHPLLHNHALKGSFRAYRSINISGDLRAIFEVVDGDTIRFIDIGNHHDLYGT